MILRSIIAAGRTVHCSALLLAASLAFAVGCSKPPTIAQNGGYVLVYHLVPGDKASPESMAQVIQARLHAAGFKRATATANPGGGVRIELPALKAGEAARTTELEQVKVLVAHQGVIEFLIVAERGPDDELIADAEDLAPSVPAPPDATYRWVRFDPNRLQVSTPAVVRTNSRGEQEALVLLDADFRVTAALLDSASAGFDPAKRPCLHGTFNAEGAAMMGFLSQNNLKRKLGIVYDDELLSAPLIQSKFERHFQVSGAFTEAEIDSMVAVLISGSLPGRLEKEPASEEYIQK
jgi:preprotein translocase subunit SecD